MKSVYYQHGNGRSQDFSSPNPWEDRTLSPANVSFNAGQRDLLCFLIYQFHCNETMLKVQIALHIKDLEPKYSNILILTTYASYFHHVLWLPNLSYHSLLCCHLSFWMALEELFAAFQGSSDCPVTSFERTWLGSTPKRTVLVECTRQCW